jgi:hypothetical protein
MSGFTSTSSAVVAGKLGQGLKFDGVDDYVNLANPTSLPTVTPLTYSVWVKYTTSPSLNFIIDVGDTSPLLDTAIYYNGGFRTGVAGSGSNSSGVTATINKWEHVVMTYDGSDTYLYVNGVLRSGPIATTPGSPTVDAARLGRRLDNSFPSAGSIDDVRIYNRALSATEISQLYRLGR